MGGRPVDPVFTEREHRKATPADLAAYERALEILDPGACPNLGQLIGRLALGVPAQREGSTSSATARELANARKALKAAQEEIERRDQRIVALQARLERGDEKVEERMRRALDAEVEAHAETRDELTKARAEGEAQAKRIRGLESERDELAGRVDGLKRDLDAKPVPVPMPAPADCPVCFALRQVMLGVLPAIAKATTPPKRPPRLCVIRLGSISDAILHVLRDATEPLSSVAIAERANLSPNRVQTNIWHLWKAGHIVRSGSAGGNGRNRGFRYVIAKVPA